MQIRRSAGYAKMPEIEPSAHDQSRLLFICVTENLSDWVSRVRNMVVSVRMGPAKLPAARILVLCVGGVDERLWGPLRNLDVEFRAVEPFDMRFPHTNKLRIFEQTEARDPTSRVVAIDCDVLLAGPLHGVWNTESVRAVPEDQPVLSEAHWAGVYERLGIAEPDGRVVALSSASEMLPWWNSGVILLPGSLAAPLHRAWSENIAAIAPLHDAGGLPARWVTDQTAFAAAIVGRAVPFHELPFEFNFPAHSKVHPNLRAARPGPASLIHYHHAFDHVGFVLACGDEVVNRQIDEHNRSLASFMGRAYGGLQTNGSAAGLHREAVRRTKRLLRSQGWYQSPFLRRGKAAMKRTRIGRWLR